MDEIVPVEIEECHSCMFKTRTLHRVVPPYGSKRKADFWFCTICYSTFAGTAAQYPDQYDEKESMRMIAYVGNVILRALGKEI